MKVHAGDISCTRSLSNFPGIESGPIALCGLMLFSSFMTHGVVS